MPTIEETKRMITMTKETIDVIKSSPDSTDAEAVRYIKMLETKLIYLNLELQMDIARKNGSKELYTLLLDRCLIIVNEYLEIRNELVVDGKFREQEYIQLCNEFKNIIANHRRICDSLHIVIDPNELVGDYISKLIKKFKSDEDAEYLLETICGLYDKLYDYFVDNRHDIRRECLRVLDDMIDGITREEDEVNNTIVINVSYKYKRIHKELLNQIRYADLNN
jgi:hypothetical protein